MSKNRSFSARNNRRQLILLLVTTRGIVWRSPNVFEGHSVPGEAPDHPSGGAPVPGSQRRGFIPLAAGPLLPQPLSLILVILPLAGSSAR